MTWRIFLSAQLGHLSREENCARHAALVAACQKEGITYRKVIGCYNSRREDTVCLSVSTAREAAFAAREAVRYGQESIMVVSPDDRATLVYCADGRRESIGTYRAVSVLDAIGRDNYTIDGQRYYVAA